MGDLPGFAPARLTRLMRESVERCDLDLRGATILTEAAAGAYVVTPILAAMAGALRVYAITRNTRHGTVEQVTAETHEAARMAGVEDRIDILVDKLPDALGKADIVTNSGHVRPIDGEFIGCLKPTAVIPLMYESWEFREGDVDLSAARKKGIPVAGTNERHPAVDVFSYLGIMAIKLLLDAGIAVYGSRLLLLCDNAFASFIGQGLSRGGATVDSVSSLSSNLGVHNYDAIVVALRPLADPALGRTDAETISGAFTGTVVVQFWGDIDRGAFADLGVRVWPVQPPPSGHMGILPSAVGPEPVVRLQTGGLKVGELLWRARLKNYAPADAVREAVAAGFADSLQ